MSDNALHYFYEAATAGSMRLASEKVGVAVSSISRQIAQLEQNMGVALIERGRRSIRLTEAGEHTFEFYKNQRADREALMLKLLKMRYKYEQYRHLKLDYVYTNEKKVKF